MEVLIFLLQIVVCAAAMLERIFSWLDAVTGVSAQRCHPAAKPYGIVPRHHEDTARLLV